MLSKLAFPVRSLATKPIMRFGTAMTMPVGRRLMSSSSSSSAQTAAATAKSASAAGPPPMTIDEILELRKKKPGGPLDKLSEDDLRWAWKELAGKDGRVDMQKHAMKNPVGVSLHTVLENVDTSQPKSSEEEVEKWFQSRKDEHGQVYVDASQLEGDIKQPPDIRNGDFLAAIDEFVPDRPGWGVTYLANPPKRKRSKYPVPPVADCPGIILPESLNPEYNEDLPYTLDRSEGVTVIQFKEGHPYHSEGEMVLGAMQMTLEWVMPSPPPLHTFDEQPIIKQRPSWEDDNSFTYGDD